MKLLGYATAAGLCLAVGALSHFLLVPRQQPGVQPLLTYDTPVKVLTKIVAPGDEFITESTRCNNTDEDLPVQVAMWLQNDSKQLAPFRIEQNGVMVGPRFDTQVAPGCRENYRSTFMVPMGVPAGAYELIGQVCYGGTASPDSAFTCRGWSSEKFEVRSR